MDRAEQEPQKGWQKILLVDDQPDDLFLTMRALKLASFSKVTVMHNGQEALAFLRNSSGGENDSREALPDLVIVDINMPVMNGVEMIKEMRKDPELSHVRVIVLSSSTNPRDKEQCLAMGVTGYLTKPPLPADLKRVIDSYSP